MEDPSLETGEDEFLSDGCSVVELQIVRSPDQIFNDKKEDMFRPLMCHQVFGQSETVYGYSNLVVKLAYDALSFRCLFETSFDRKIEKNMVTGVAPDDYVSSLKNWIPEDYLENKKEFIRLMEQSPAPKPFGVVTTAFKIEGDNLSKDFEIRVIENAPPEYGEFHHRMESLIVWFIDAANFIDTDDPKWRFYVVYEKVRQDGKDLHYPVGFATVYEYFAYPDKHRYRISQFIIFPPHQGIGLGSALLKAIYDNIKTLPKVHDITVEEPSIEFQTLRDFVDVGLCENLPSFTGRHLQMPYNKEMITEAKDTFNLCDRQIRRAYDILRLSKIGKTQHAELKKYKDMLTRRLSKPRFKRDNQIRARVLANNEAAENDQDNEEKKEDPIKEAVLSMISQYKHVVRKRSHPINLTTIYK